MNSNSGNTRANSLLMIYREETRGSQVRFDIHCEIEKEFQRIRKLNMIIEEHLHYFKYDRLIPDDRIAGVTSAICYLCNELEYYEYAKIFNKHLNRYYDDKHKKGI